MKSRERFIKTWTSLEQRHGCTGELPSGNAAHVQAFRALYGERDGSKAETIARRKRLDPLQRLRFLIHRGRHAEAQKLLEHIEKPKHASASRTQADSEKLIESARLAAFKGDWKFCLEACDDILLGPLFPISRLTVRQIRALAGFELGLFSEASRDLEWVESIQSVFPKASPVLYSQITRIRISARDRSPKAAQETLAKIASDLARAGTLNSDTALTILRAEIDLQRLNYKPVYSLAIACYLLAALMGDEFYAALACLDARFSEVSSLPEWIESNLEKSRLKYERIRRLEEEGQGKSTTASTTGLGLGLEIKSTHSKKYSISQRFPEKIEGIESIALLRSKLLLRFKPSFKVDDLSDHPKMLALLGSASKESNKENIFPEVWGISPYHSIRHGNVIHQLIHRMKSEFGIEFESDKSTLVLENCWVVNA